MQNGERRRRHPGDVDTEVEITDATGRTTTQVTLTITVRPARQPS